MDLPRLSEVSDSLFLPLLCRVLESRSSHPLIRDPRAESIYERLKPSFAAGQRPMHRQLTRGKLPRLMVVTVALRTRRFDRYVQDFRAQVSDGLVVNLGCGLDTRFSRLDDGRLEWVDLDYPEVIELRRHFFENSERYRMLPASVLDTAWLETVASWAEERPVLFLAEGLLMYLQPSEVKSLLTRLCQRFTRAELAAEVVHASLVEKFQASRYLRWKFEHQLHLGPDALFRFGLHDSRGFEAWDPRLHYLDDWAWFDDHDAKLLLLNWLGHVEAMRHLQWIVRYGIGEGKGNRQ